MASKKSSTGKSTDEGEMFVHDLEETDEMLDTSHEPLEFWQEKQKELITNVVDYNLSTLVDLIEDEAVNLNPSYQRRLRWDVRRQSKLIESFLMNVPVPPIFLNEDEYGKYSIIDGKQRLDAIRKFLTNNLVLEGLEVFSDINGMRFSDLPSTLGRILRTRPTVRAIIILRQSDRDVKYEVFQRLNTGGAKLNAQEIRNNAFHGPLNKLVMDLSEHRKFHLALGIKNKHRSAIYQHMRDAELVLRFFTFKDSWANFPGGMKREMDKYAEDNRNATDATLKDIALDFIRTVDAVTAVFDTHAFQRWIPEKASFRKQVVAAVYDAQMFSFADYAVQDVAAHKEAILDGFKRLCGQSEFVKSIDAATNTPSLFKWRIGAMKKLLHEIIV